MKIEIEVSDEIVKQFGEQALKTFLEFKVQNLAQLPESDANEAVTKEQTDEAWEKVKKMGPSC